MVNVELPYEAGALVKTIEDGTEHVDRIAEYVRKKKDGKISIFVVLNLGGRLSTEVELEDFLTRWKEV